MEGLEGTVDRLEVAPHHHLAALAVAALDRAPNGVEGALARQHAREGEEAGLHHGVDAPPHARLPRDPVGIDGPDPQLLLEDRFLHLPG